MTPLALNKMPRVTSRHLSVAMELVLPAAVTPVMTVPMSIVRPRSDVDPRYDDHSPAASLRRGCTQH